ncbi:MAG TPA: class I SAM-dependent methyltransferase [Kofleriaceae bacterium]|jgi:SAM-dependent methyltransferase|nr:class I SAM-dependent methyltransferase [Kofleriaceae bacterium]
MSVFQPQQAAAPAGANVDVALEMRRGHVGIEDTDRTLLGVFRDHLARRAGDAPLRIFDICSGSGFFIRRLSRELPEAAAHELFAHEDDPGVLPLLQARLQDSAIRIHTGSFCDWREPIDVLLTWGSFHHMPRSYLAHARTLLRPGGLVILADEFCPEYLTPEMVERVRSAPVIHIASGYVLTSDAELAAYERTGALPAIAVEMERLRQQVLWKWYRHVVDVMMERACLNAALYELRTTRDDLDTAFGSEHKLSPVVGERELALLGFELVSRHVPVAEAGAPARDSFFVYVYRAR